MFSQANFGNVFSLLVGATSTFFELIHPLVKLPNCVLKQQPHILQFIPSARLFRLSHSSRSRDRLCCRTATSTHFWSSLYILHFTICTTFHRETTLKTAFELLDYSVKIRSQVQTIKGAILARNQSPSVSNSQSYLMVSVITMCTLIKRLIRATFLSTPASAVLKRWKQTARTSD